MSNEPAVPDAGTVDVVVVGAGFSGLGMLWALRRLGLRARAFEAGSGLGGTWFWNKYPGARVDVESAWYSYRFSPELDQEWEWTEKYPTQAEILRYLEHVADRFDLRRDITFDTRVESAAWDDDAQRWEILTDQGERLLARYFVMASGNLSAVKGLELPGEDRFGGRVYHTGRWPQGGVDFSGQRVGVVGTGSSGVQVIPIVAAQAERLTVFQRTANFAFPANNRPLDPDAVAEIKGSYPELRRLQAETFFGIPDEQPTQSALEVSAEERLARFEAGWERGTLNALLASYYDLLLDERANDLLADFVRGKIRAIVRDPQVAEDLAPRGYPIGAKRACMESGYYEVYNRENVELVNLRRTPLVEMTERGLRTTQGEHELDAIILATGYDAITGSLLAVDIRGRGGASLREAWSDGPQSYLGLAVAGFPNLFTVTGPGSPSVLSNMAFSMQEHIDWIAGQIGYMEDRGIASVETTAEAQADWMAHVVEVADSTLIPRADSWYTGANVPGKPRSFSTYLGGVAAYRQRLQEVAANDYEGFVRRDRALAASEQS